MTSLRGVMNQLTEAREAVAQMRISADPHAVPGLRCERCGRESAHPSLVGARCAFCDPPRSGPMAWEKK